MEKRELMQHCKTNFATAFWADTSGEKLISWGKVVTVNEIQDDESLAEGFWLLGWIRKGATMTAYC